MLAWGRDVMDRGTGMVLLMVLSLFCEWLGFAGLAHAFEVGALLVVLRIIIADAVASGVRKANEEN
jgi:hypothetical protein